MAPNIWYSPSPAKSNLISEKDTGGAPTAPTTQGVNQTIKTGTQLLQTVGAPKPASRQPALDRAPSGVNRNLYGDREDGSAGGGGEEPPDRGGSQPPGGGDGGGGAPGGYGGPGTTPPSGGTGGAGGPAPPRVEGQFWSDRVQSALMSVPPAARQAAMSQSWGGNPDTAEAWYENARAAGALGWSQNDWSQDAAPDTYSQRDWSSHPNAAIFDEQYNRLISMGIPAGRARRIVSIALGGMEHDWQRYNNVPLDFNDGWGDAWTRVSRFLEGDRYYDPSCPQEAPYKSQHGGTGCVEKPWDVAFGEKIHEILVSEEEANHCVERGKYYAILPMLPELRDPCEKGSCTLTKEFSSADVVLDRKGSIELLKRNRLMVEDLETLGDGDLLR